MTLSILDVRPTADPRHWLLSIGDACCVGPVGNVFMYGGVGLGAAIVALERACGRPVAWAMAHYLGPARKGSVLDIETIVPAVGRGTVQARAVGRVGDADVVSVSAALGGRPDGVLHQWIEAPAAPPPEDCPPTGWGLPQAPGNMFERLDMRDASGSRASDRRAGEMSSDGRSRMWLRTREASPLDAGLLAIFADFLAAGLGVATGGGLAGVSLDNTLRVRTLVPTPWVLCDTQIHGLGHGFAHGDTRLFAQSGELLAIASQTMAARAPSSVTEPKTS